MNRENPGTASNSIFNRIKEKGDQLSPKQVQLARHIISNYKIAAFQTIAEVAKESRVSEATVVRLAAALDYSGYPEMLDDLQEIVRHELDAFEHIRHTYKGEQLKKLNIIETIVTNEQKNMAKVLESITVADTARVVDAICAADKVIVIGFYAESYLAQYFGYNLGKVKENVTIINQDSVGLFNLLLSCTDRTVVFIFSFPRYLQKEQLLGEVLKQKNPIIIGVTDSVLAPLKAVSTQLLAIPQNYTSFSDPGCAFMVLLQAIIMEYLSRSPEKTEALLQQFDDYAEHMNLWR